MYYTSFKLKVKTDNMHNTVHYAVRPTGKQLYKPF